MLNHYAHYCTKQQQLGRYRTLPTQPDAVHDFASNDYLSLSQSPLLYQAALEAGERYGVGATGARLLTGNHNVFTALESCIADAKGTEAALVINSGFQANSTVLSSLLDQRVLPAKPIVFFDRLNHASLYQAVFLSKAQLVRYRHNDMQHLHDLLLRYQSSKQPKFIVAETLFGMEGDCLPLTDIVQLAHAHQAFLYLDEAHATGVLGAQGYGLANGLDLPVPHVIMGTFSKALGCCGAYIACSAQIKDYLLNACPGLIYSTAPSPMLIGAVAKAWETIPSLANERSALFLTAASLRDALCRHGFRLTPTTTHIIPVIVTQDAAAIRAKNVLLQAGIAVSAIRSPTVPPFTARLRIALNISHSAAAIADLLDALLALFTPLPLK